MDPQLLELAQGVRETLVQDVTLWLRDASLGSKEALDRIFPLLERELKAIARNFMRQERSRHTLQPTALVHEAYIRLVGEKPVDFRDRNHFLRLASKKMREILINYAKMRGSKKRGGDWKRVYGTLTRVVAPPETFSIHDWVALAEAMEWLQKSRLAECERLLSLAEMRFFGGMEYDEMAETLGISTRQIKREMKRLTMLLLYFCE